MRRVAVIAAVLAGCSPVWAGSPFNVPTEAQKRRAVVPYIRALTSCVARVSLTDPDGAVQYRAGLFAGYVSRQLRNCPAEMNAILDVYESTFGDGEAGRFIRGPYLADLKRAVLSLIKPQLDAKVEAAQQREVTEREQQAARDAGAARHKAEEDARLKAELEAAARVEAEKLRFIDEALVANQNDRSVKSPAFEREAVRNSNDIFQVLPPKILQAPVKQNSAQDELNGYAMAHHLSMSEIVKQTGHSVIDIVDYIEGGKKAGRTSEDVISWLLAIKVTPIDRNTIQMTSLVSKDMPMIVDTYKKNEMRFVRDFKGKRFDDDTSFANARQNLITSGSYTVIFGAGGFGGNLTCETSDPKEVNTIADLDKGDRVHVSGEVKDVTFGDIQLRDCTMQHR